MMKRRYSDRGILAALIGATSLLGAHLGSWALRGFEVVCR
jgi:hypothetical protein